MSLVKNLIKNRWLKTPEIIDAFRHIKRIDFLPEELKNLAELNEALAIGEGQTISQPLVVAFMLELLKPQPGEKILDIGAGSGWTSALLAYIVSKEKFNEKSKGRVIAIDIIPKLMKFGKNNVSKYNFIKKGVVKFFCADGSKGYPDISSCSGLSEGFDKILCSAAAKTNIPVLWRKQLKKGGIIVAPIDSSIWFFEKESENRFQEVEYPGFSFVPLIKNSK